MVGVPGPEYLFSVQARVGSLPDNVEMSGPQVSGTLAVCLEYYKTLRMPKTFAVSKGRKNEKEKYNEASFP